MKTFYCQECRVVAQMDPSEMIETHECSGCGEEKACYIYFDKFELVTVYLHSEMEYIEDKGVGLGLTGDALNEFRTALHEVGITLKVDTDTGKYEIVGKKET